MCENTSSTKIKRCQDCLFRYLDKADCKLVTEYDYEDEEDILDFMQYCAKETAKDLVAEGMEIDTEEVSPDLFEAVELAICFTDDDRKARFNLEGETSCEFYRNREDYKGKQITLKLDA